MLVQIYTTIASRLHRHDLVGFMSTVSTSYDNFDDDDDDDVNDNNNLLYFKRQHYNHNP